ncbi:MAG: restriction endonuclease subunit S, partial [Planctomycetes bacterium]|nr:restriction endonuclease subunit S [Planctomycetota bacterium]
MSWPMQQLNEVADFRLGKMLDEKKNRGDLMPYLANVNVRWGEFDFRELREMRFEDHELDTFGLRHGDIVMCEGGEPGRCAIWKEQRPGMMIQKAIHRIRPHACLNHEFLYYTFLNLGMTGRFSPLFTGATIKHLPREKIALLEVPVPPLPEQIRIASVLSAYDDLIENNRRRMALLEESARLLYQEWFVRLRFPGHEHVRIVDGVPEGWERRTL